VLWLLLWHAGSFASSGSALAVHQVSVGEDGTPQPADRACLFGYIHFIVVFCFLQLNVEAGLARHLSHPAGAPSAHGSQVGAVACGSDSGARQRNDGACSGNQLPHRPESTSLHNFVYNGDFAGFRQALSLLAQHENFPHLLGALQMNDAQVRWAGFPRWYLHSLALCTSQLLSACAQWQICGKMTRLVHGQLPGSDQTAAELRQGCKAGQCYCMDACLLTGIKCLH
jgi:hypothetical protein